MTDFSIEGLNYMAPVNELIQGYIFEEGYTALGGDSHYTTTTFKLLYSPLSDLP